MEKNKTILIGMGIVLILIIGVLSIGVFSGSEEKTEQKDLTQQTIKEDQQKETVYINKTNTSNVKYDNISLRILEKYLNDTDLNLPELPEEI